MKDLKVELMRDSKWPVLMNELPKEFIDNSKIPENFKDTNESVNLPASRDDENLENVVQIPKTGSKS